MHYFSFKTAILGNCIKKRPYGYETEIFNTKIKFNFFNRNFECIAESTKGQERLPNLFMCFIRHVAEMKHMH